MTLIYGLVYLNIMDVFSRDEGDDEDDEEEREVGGFAYAAWPSS